MPKGTAIPAKRSGSRDHMDYTKSIQFQRTIQFPIHREQLAANAWCWG